MTARISGAEDYTTHDGTNTAKVKAKCGCGVHAVGSLRAIIDSLPVLREAIAAANLPPSLPLFTWRCRDCGERVTLTLRHLHLIG